MELGDERERKDEALAITILVITKAVAISLLLSNINEPTEDEPASDGGTSFVCFDWSVCFVEFKGGICDHVFCSLDVCYPPCQLPHKLESPSCHTSQLGMFHSSTVISNLL
ncbi:unnamed protein product [Moneuplotes crassus]|uniref:Uncharacterized protein n=1 Tax=Euplotes crassus TaxID=5936 RepID=A0AAD1XWY6_EUPCR|nr:unnamed protein product [Moneuplotes crassus]